MNNAQTFHFYGTSRICNEAALPLNPLQVVVNEGTGAMAEESPVHSVAYAEHTETREVGAELVSGD